MAAETVLGLPPAAFATIVASTLSLVGALGTAAIARGMLSRKNHQIQQRDQALQVQRVGLDLAGYMQDWDGLHTELDTLFEETNISRFMLLRAVNGVLTPETTTAVYQYHKEKGFHRSYMHYGLDPHYIGSMVTMIHQGAAVYVTAEMPNSATVKHSYMEEGVKAAYWGHIETTRIVNTDCAAITYLSLATHDSAGISDATQARCRNILDRLRYSAHAFHQQTNMEVVPLGA